MGLFLCFFLLFCFFILFGAFFQTTKKLLLNFVLFVNLFSFSFFPLQYHFEVWSVLVCSSMEIVTQPSFWSFTSGGGEQPMEYAANGSERAYFVCANNHGSNLIVKKHSNNRYIQNVFIFIECFNSKLGSIWCVCFAKSKRLYWNCSSTITERDCS